MVSFSLTFFSCLATHGFCSSVSLTSIVRPRTNLHLHARANGPIFLPDSNLISFSEIVNLEFYFGKVFLEEQSGAKERSWAIIAEFNLLPPESIFPSFAAS